MKATGIVRRIDDLGRIVLPKELRRVMEIKEGDPLEIYTEEDQIILKKYTPDKLVCAHCGETRSLLKVGEKYICRKCAIEAYTATRGE